MSVDFNPVAEAKRLLVLTQKAKERGLSHGEGSVLIDYIVALRDALRETQQYVDKIADEWDSATADNLAHTIRHLLDD